MGPMKNSVPDERLVENAGWRVMPGLLDKHKRPS